MTFFGKLIYFILFSMLGIGFVFTNGPRLENKYFRVVEDVAITSFRPVEDGVIITVKFNKVRSCVYNPNIVWYEHIPNAKRSFDLIDFENLELGDEGRGITRPIGIHYAGPWKIKTKYKRLSDFKDYIHAYVSHTCHPFWTTNTQFYPSRINEHSHK